MRRTRPSRPSPRGPPRQVVPGENVVLDGGSTNAALAEELKDFRSLSVATIGLTSLEALADAEDIEVILLGGRLRTVSQSFVGPVTEAALERMSFDRAFMGADGVRADRGICEKDLEQTRLKELMMRRADHVYVLAHAAKIGGAVPRVGGHAVALDPGDRLVGYGGGFGTVPGQGGRSCRRFLSTLLLLGLVLGLVRR